MRSSLLTPIIICAIVGAAGGLVVTLIVPGFARRQYPAWRIVRLALRALSRARAPSARARVCSGASATPSFCGLRFQQASFPC